MRGYFNKILITLLTVVICGILIDMPQHVKANDMPYNNVNMGDYISGYEPLNKDNIVTEKNSDGSWNIKKTDEGDYKVLQLTDVHLSAGDVYTEKNKKAMDAVYAIVEQVRPDIIEMTGDYVFAMPYTDNNQDYETLKMCMKFMDQIGIPWIWTFGNHDHDFFDRYTQKQVQSLLEMSDTLIKYDIDESVDGYTNGEFRLYNKDNTLNRILISVDSHDYRADSDYDYIHDNQVEWYEDIIKKDKKLFGDDVQSFVYTHIPLMEYNDAWNAYNGGDIRAEYISGTKREDVCCSSIRGKMGTVMSQLKSTQAVFCGHDHLNDYIIKYCGVIYAYSKSIDYSAYEGIENLTSQRGATVLTLAKDGENYDITSIKLTDIKNENDSQDTLNPYSMSYNNEIVTEDNINLFLDSDGIWEYYKDGYVDYTYTGMARNEYGWWYVTDGIVDFDYTGLSFNMYGWWYIKNGAVDFDYTGLADNENGWWYIEGGKVNFNYRGLANNEIGWWYIEGGKVNFNYRGLANNENGWWYIEDGKVNFNYRGLADNEYGLWYIEKGKVEFSYTGFVKDEDNTWFVEGGEVKKDFKEMPHNTYETKIIE